MKIVIMLLMNPEENIQSVEDPNQRWQNNALMAVSDPNGIYKRIEEYKQMFSPEEREQEPYKPLFEREFVYQLITIKRTKDRPLSR